jgi:cytochrome c
LPDGVDYSGNLPNGQPINAETVAAWIRSGGQGKVGVMPPMQMLKEEEIEEIIEYLQGLYRKVSWIKHCSSE